jgi:hypothetical protein
MGNSTGQPRYFSGPEVAEILAPATISDIRAFLAFYCPRDK